MMCARCSSLSFGSTRRPRLLTAAGSFARVSALRFMVSLAFGRGRVRSAGGRLGTMRLDVLEQRAPDLGDPGMAADLQPLDEREQRAQAVLVGDLARIGREVLCLAEHAVEDAVG